MIIRIDTLPPTGTLPGLDHLIERIGQLRASPTVAHKLLVLTRNPEFEVAQVAACLERDPALAARLLRVVNSSRYGLTRKVGNVRHAANYLGQRSLRLFAITFALVETLTTGRRSRSSADYWPQAFLMASAASVISRNQSPDSREDAYTSGLLADVGVLVFAQFEPERYQPLFDRHEHGPALIAAEQEEFGFSHPLVGARLLQTWEVPERVVLAVANHHDPLSSSSANPLEQVVKAANVLTTAFPHPTPERLALVEAHFQQAFGLTRAGLLALVQELQETLIDGEDLADCGSRPAKQCKAFVLALAKSPPLAAPLEKIPMTN